MNYILVAAIFFALIFDKLNIFFYLIVSAFLHETGHIAVCLLSGHIPQIEISVFGIKMKGYPKQKHKKLCVLIAGPFVNLVLIILSVIKLHNAFSLNTYIFMSVNILLLLFNCLPVCFLDGGQILELFCDNDIIRKILDVFSVIILLIGTIALTQNNLWSIYTFIIFIIYYLINKYIS